MAVIWRKRGGFKVFITPHGEPPTNEDVELAKKYDEELQKKLDRLQGGFKEKVSLRYRIK